jgi:hypothetical protein
VDGRVGFGRALTDRVEVSQAAEQRLCAERLDLNDSGIIACEGKNLDGRVARPVSDEARVVSMSKGSHAPGGWRRSAVGRSWSR